jgi:dihydroneopterin aldolase/2-amino-4-hydroxy-6-hydroxymethyldihydropteridine diphosphokinase
MLDEKRHDLSRGADYLGLGSNVGARESNVIRAISSIDSRVARVMATSSLYESEPVGCGPMRDFVNAVVEVQTLLCAEDLLKRLQELEIRLGRRAGHNQPRTLDIDIVACGGMVVRSEQLCIPHPKYHERMFVLEPLREIAPGFRCPVTGRDIAAIIAKLSPSQSVTRISSRSITPRSAPPTERLQYVCSDQEQDDE